MNKNLRRLIDSNDGIYFIVLSVFALVSFVLGYFFFRDTAASRPLLIISAVEAGIVVVLLIFFMLTMKRKQAQLVSYIESVTYDSENAKKNTLMNFPLPVAVFRIDDSRIVWANDAFFKACGNTGTRLDAKISDLVPDFSGKWLMEGKSQYPALIPMLGRKFRVHGNTVRPDNEADRAYMGITYWFDITEYDDTRIEYEQSRPVASVLVIDNYDELIKNLPDREKYNIRDAIEDRIFAWVGKYKGIVRRFERDRYLVILEKRNLEEMKQDKFSILEEMHQVESPTGFTASMSIGFGEDAPNFSESLQFADMAMDLALTRGGDQAVVKNRLSFEFYGGRGNEVEKRTKVKSRVMANTLNELIKDSSRVYIMGHRYADPDCVGSAVGVCSLCRQNGIRYNIVIDADNNSAKPLMDVLTAVPEYKDVFVTTQDAILRADGRTLLVIVDTNRPEQVEDADLLDACNRVAVVDHHRVAATYIHNAALGFIEPYASSASELITEVLQEVGDISAMLKVEADALLTGMVLDTKNFTIRTGERTFDAAAYLRRAGADTTDVKKLLQSNMDDTIARYKILQSAELYRNVAIAAPEETTDRIVAAKAADELLNISGVEASIVVAPGAGDGCFASARSIGELNVQILMEKLGGGGNRSAAAAQLPDMHLAEAKAAILKAIDEYLG